MKVEAFGEYVVDEGDRCVLDLENSTTGLARKWLLLTE